MSKAIQVVEVISNSILKEFKIDKFEDAFQFAKEMEKLGLEIKINSPSLPETLAIGLGASQEDITYLREVIEEEMKSHDGHIPSKD